MLLNIDDLGIVGIVVDDWDITKEFKPKTITTDYSSWICYISRRAVPSNVPITDTYYWKPLFRLEKTIAFDYNSFKEEVLEKFFNLSLLVDTFLRSSKYGVALANELGDDVYKGINQKVITKSINDIWSILEDITGEVYKGISMATSPKYYIGEDGCSVHIVASTIRANGIFEKIKFEKWEEGDTQWSIIGQEYENVDHIELSTEINSTTEIKCTAKILGESYTKTDKIVHYPSLFLGAGTTYEDMLFDGQFNPAYAIPVKNNMRGAYDVTVENGEHIIIVVGDALKDDFIRADINGVEIEFTSELVPVDGKYFKVFTSVNTYQAGVINVDING